jgi:Domain of unknown function (DUF1707)
MEAFWESFRLDPRQPGHASMRASDADREIVRAVLADAYADGRLAREEYDDRLNTLYGSRTLGEMPSLVTDLGHSGRLTFRLVRSPGELIELMTLVLDGTLDAHSRDDLTRMTPVRPHRSSTTANSSATPARTSGGGSRRCRTENRPGS